MLTCNKEVPVLVTAGDLSRQGHVPRYLPADLQARADEHDLMR